ncbi:unnamed protein product [Diamesa tonsa]
MVHTKTFLCCFDLETGGIFLGWLGIVYNTLSLFVVPVIDYVVNIFIEAKAQKEIEMNNSVYNSLYGGYGQRGYGRYNRGTRLLSDGQMNNALETVSGVATFLVVVFYVMIILKLIAAIFLLIGTKRRNHQYVFVYLIIEGIFRVLSMINSMIMPPYFFVDIFWIYVSISTFSLYKKFEKQSRRGTSIELTSINTVVHPPMIQDNGAFGQPMLSSYQENLKMRDANQLPSYDKVVPSASTN